jgi:predicted secreted protein
MPRPSTAMTMNHTHFSRQTDEAFQVRLHSSSASGFIWMLDELPDGLHLVEWDASPGDLSKTAGGTDTFTFKGTRPGEYVIRFCLCRPRLPVAIDEMQYSVSIA